MVDRLRYELAVSGTATRNAHTHTHAHADPSRGWKQKIDKQAAAALHSTMKEDWGDGQQAVCGEGGE